MKHEACERSAVSTVNKNQVKRHLTYPCANASTKYDDETYPVTQHTRGAVGIYVDPWVMVVGLKLVYLTCSACVVSPRWGPMGVISQSALVIGIHMPISPTSFGHL